MNKVVDDAVKKMDKSIEINQETLIGAFSSFIGVENFAFDQIIPCKPMLNTRIQCQDISYLMIQRNVALFALYNPSLYRQPYVTLRSYNP